MIEARCDSATETLTIPEVVTELERIWMEELRHLPYEAHAATHHDDEASLDFVTLSAREVSSLAGSLWIRGRSRD